MHKFFTPKELISDVSAKVIGDDVKHIYKVLRLTEGTVVVLNNCEGKEYLCEVADVSKQEVLFNIKEELKINNESRVQITLFQGLPKAQKMDLIVQKGTELGISSFVPCLTERVDVKLRGDFKKLDRLNRIALEAAKQSKRSIVPDVKTPIEFDEVLNSINEYDLFLVPYENREDFGIKTLMNEISNKDDIKKIAILVGPEGGFEEEEINILKDKGAYIITLGSRILRTETAGFTATALVQYELGDLGGLV